LQLDRIEGSRRTKSSIKQAPSIPIILVSFELLIIDFAGNFGKRVYFGIKLNPDTLKFFNFTSVGAVMLVGTPVQLNYLKSMLISESPLNNVSPVAIK
jgi:hypothetical protein